VDQEHLYRRLAHDDTFRQSLTYESFYWFFHVYFSRYCTYETAPFQQEMAAELQYGTDPFLLILSFRGSAKTTYANTAYTIWSMIGKPRERYAVLIGDTQTQSNQYLHNIKTELEENRLLIGDWGPFEPDGTPDEWRKTTLLVKRYGARVSAISDGQNVRGLREQEKRPGLVIADDLENTESVRHKEQRDNRYRWLKQDVMGVGDRGTRFILIGNLLHSDSLLMRVKNEIETGKMKGKVLQYPITLDGTMDTPATWRGKFPDRASLEEERKRIGDERTWQRECMLKIVPDEGRPVLDEWIQYYETLPQNVSAKAIGVDLAISKKTTADYTAFAPVYLAYEGADETPTLYVRPTFHERLSFHETIQQARSMIAVHGMDTMLFVEGVAYQQAAVEEMREREALPVVDVRPGSDKTARLRAISTHIQSGRIKFPKSGCEDLLIELLGWGTEAHDDLVDAFVYACLGLLEGYANRPTIFHV
jgi:predicted phage terminase large subunit-like protein